MRPKVCRWLGAFSVAMLCLALLVYHPCHRLPVGHAGRALFLISMPPGGILSKSSIVAVQHFVTEPVEVDARDCRFTCTVGRLECCKEYSEKPCSELAICVHSITIPNILYSCWCGLQESWQLWLLSPRWLISEVLDVISFCWSDHTNCSCSKLRCNAHRKLVTVAVRQKKGAMFEICILQWWPPEHK